MKKNLIIGIILFTVISVGTLGMKAFNNADLQVEQQSSSYYTLTAYVDWYSVTPGDMDENGYYKFELKGSYDSDFIDLIESSSCQTRPSLNGTIGAENGVLYLYTPYGGVSKGNYFILYSGYNSIADITIK